MTRRVGGILLLGAIGRAPPTSVGPLAGLGATSVGGIGLYKISDVADRAIVGGFRH